MGSLVLFSRLMGQETEYAIRFSPLLRRPGNDVIYEAIAKAISEVTRTEPGMYSERPQIFLENGGAFHYEYLPYRVDGGLIEGATPECRGPVQLLLYQRAQETLLMRAVARAQSALGRSGFPGTLGLLKNCKDAEGHIYGAQESFEVRFGPPFALWAYRVGLALLTPLLFVNVLLTWLLVVVLVLGSLGLALAGTVVALVVPPSRQIWQRLFRQDDRTLENRLGRFLYWLTCAVTWPFITLFSFLLHGLAFRKMRRELTPFLVTRAVYSGGGTVEEDGVLLLSEKGPSIRRLMRLSISPDDRAIFDTGNLMKPLLAAVYFHLRPLAGLFRSRVRMQLGLADSNVLEEAEFLKMGTTALVVDMIEAGALRDVPVMGRPVKALHQVVADPSLKASVSTRRGPMTALEIQRYYLEEAKRFIREAPTKSIEAEEVLRLWDDVLTRLEKGRLDELVGRVDWVTKRYLLETCGGTGTDARLKTIDLRYHELGDGYGARLAGSGHARKLLSADDIERATLNPPEGTPAFIRGHFIRQQSALSGRFGLVPVRISWDMARIGGRLSGKVVRFPGPNG